jgi:hypothetical protein
MITKSLTYLTAGAVLAATLGSAQSLHAQQASAGKPLATEPVLSVLTVKLDTKKSKVGDPVAAKTLNSLTLSDGGVLPSGTKLTGKVTQVTPKSSGNPTIAIAFDQLEKKGAAPMPVHGSLMAVAPEPTLAEQGPTKDFSSGRGNSAMTGAAASPGAGTLSTSSALPSIQPGSSIKGVVLNPTPSADGSSVLQSTDKDFKLDSGTRLEIALTAAQ